MKSTKEGVNKKGWCWYVIHKVCCLKRGCDQRTRGIKIKYIHMMLNGVSDMASKTYVILEVASETKI